MIFGLISPVYLLYLLYLRGENILYIGHLKMAVTMTILAEEEKIIIVKFIICWATVLWKCLKIAEIETVNSTIMTILLMKIRPLYSLLPLKIQLLKDIVFKI